MNRMVWLSVLAVCSVLPLGCGASSEIRNDPLFQDTDNVYKAAEDGDLQRVLQFMDQGNWDHSVTDFNGVLPLCAAAKGGNVDIIYAMVSDGADVNARDNHGKSPLDYAKEAGKEEAVKYLMELGATE
jgi:ankyrin repeat protein